MGLASLWTLLLGGPSPGFLVAVMTPHPKVCSTKSVEGKDVRSITVSSQSTKLIFDSCNLKRLIASTNWR